MSKPEHPAGSHALRVFRILRNHPGNVIWIDDLMDDTGLRREQVVNAINTLRTKYETDVTTIQRGNAWRYNGGGSVPSGENGRETGSQTVSEPSKHVGKRFEHDANDPNVYVRLGETMDGGILIQGGDGRIYRATEL